MDRRDFLKTAGGLVAGGLAVKGSTSPRNIDPTHLRKILLENGVFLG
ncbi:MAG: twin-arginine translocation signal domain-containing protein [Alistipes sp.]|nr:twin-arginine translocation signal domain-containing protein [Alistipes sp.]